MTRFARLVVFALALGALPLAHAAWPPPSDDHAFDYSDASNWPNDPDYQSSWNFWSFVPTRLQAQVDNATRRLGTGAHYDRAWAKTTGDPRVLIAITDSGIDWSNSDLINQMFLNAGELPPPACPGNAAQRHDANGDGRFNTQDYTTVTGHALPAFDKVCDARITKDVNSNGVLDAQDLIAAFSDGKDDDGNGYIDDIGGWDFFHNDNDPADATHYGHGTGGSTDAAAETNNGAGGSGVCPQCTVVMLRVGDAFVPEVNTWSVAVAYAVDLGASVVQISGGGGLTNPAFSRDALDYAYRNNVTVIASNSDLDSFHHNYPNTNDHTISVHSIRYDAPSLDAAKTFFTFDTCTNYGAQLMLSVPDTHCSSGAAGRAGGLAGLLYAAALRADVPAPAPTAGDPAGNRRLTAEEVRQLLVETVDSFYNPADATDPTKFPTKPGFARRFGYGRANARSAVDAIFAGRLPPEVDVRAPAWFDVIYNDRTPMVPIVGRVGVRGASANPAGVTFDYVVEWAAGVDPDDDAWTQISGVTAQAAAVDGTLAMWDVSSLKIDNPVPSGAAFQPDDPANVHLVTLRVRATLHSSNPALDGAKGEARRAVHIYKDALLLPAFPVHIGSSGEGAPKLADLDGNGRREIVYGDSSGWVHAIGADGNERAGWPVRVERLPLLDPLSHVGKSHATAPAFSGATPALSPDQHSPTAAAPAIGDIDGDGQPEVVVATWRGGYVWAFHADGSVVSGFPVELDRDTAAIAVDDGHELEDGFWAAPVLADLDNDGKLEIVQAAMDAKIYVWRGDGTRLPGFPVVVHDLTQMPQQRQRIMTTPAVGDLNRDGIPDIVTGTNEDYSNQARLYVVDGRGSNAPAPYLPGWPVSLVSNHVLPVVGKGLPNSPILADLDGDGVPEVMASGIGAPLRVFDAKGKAFGPPLANKKERYGANSNAKNATDFTMVASPAVGDLDDDGTLDFVEGGAGIDALLAFASSGTRHDFEHHVLAWDSKSGAYKRGFPRVIEDWQFFHSPAVADVDGDGKVDVLAPSAGYFIHGWNVDGVEAKGFPKFTGGWNAATPAVGDLDGDGKLEVVAVTRNGWLYAWRTDARARGRIDWPSFHHDLRNSGNYGTLLDEGVRATPSSGGCGLDGASGGRGVIWVVAMALAAIYVGTRRRRGSP